MTKINDNKLIGGVRMRILSLLFSLLIVSTAFSQSKQGVIAELTGKVKVQRENGVIFDAKIGHKIMEKDIIITQKDSGVRILMRDRNILDISANSKVQIEKYVYDERKDNKQVSILVDQGRMKSIVNQKYDGVKNKFNVKTPIIVAGVRGTVFTTIHDPGKIQSEVITHEGKVEVWPRGGDEKKNLPNKVAVPAGEMVSSSNKELSAPKKTPSEVLTTLDSEDKALLTKDPVFNADSFSFY